MMANLVPCGFDSRQLRAGPGGSPLHSEAPERCREVDPGDLNRDGAPASEYRGRVRDGDRGEGTSRNCRRDSFANRRIRHMSGLASANQALTCLIASATPLCRRAPRVFRGAREVVGGYPLMSVVARDVRTGRTLPLFDASVIEPAAGSSQ